MAHPSQRPRSDSGPDLPDANSPAAPLPATIPGEHPGASSGTSSGARPSDLPTAEAAQLGLEAPKLPTSRRRLGLNPIAGASYPFRAVILLGRHPRLLLYVGVPILINLVLGVGIYLGLVSPGLRRIGETMAWLGGWLDGMETRLPHWLSWLTWLNGIATVLGWGLQAGLVVGLLLVTGFVLAQFGTLLGAPWYGQLSEQVERLRTGRLQIVEVGPIADITRAIQYELKKLVLVVGAGILFLGLNGVPALGTSIAAVEVVGLAALLVGLDFVDGPLERRRLKFRQKLGLLLRNWPLMMGFSLACLGLVSVPLVNLVSVPICVMSGTLLFCDRFWPRYFEAQEREAGAREAASKAPDLSSDGLDP